MSEVIVTQADREAAADLSNYGRRIAGMIRDGEYDGHHFVQAFARHRIATRAPSPDMAEAVEEAACRVAKHIAKNEALDRCKTLEDSLLHQQNWRRILPEAREIVAVAFQPFLARVGAA